MKMKHEFTLIENGLKMDKNRLLNLGKRLLLDERLAS